MTDSLASQGQGMKNPQKIIPKNIFFHLCYLADTKANYFFTELMKFSREKFKFRNHINT